MIDLFVSQCHVGGSRLANTDLLPSVQRRGETLPTPGLGGNTNEEVECGDALGRDYHVGI